MADKGFFAGIARRWLKPEQAAELEAELLKAQAELDKLGHARKEKKDQTDKGLIEDIEAKVGEAISGLTDNVPPDLVKTLTAAILTAVAAHATDQPIAEEPAPAEGEPMMGMEADGEGDVPMPEDQPTDETMRELIDRLDQVVEQNKALASIIDPLVSDMTEIVKENLQTMKEVITTRRDNAALDKRLKELEGQLIGRSRISSQAKETELIDESGELLKELQEGEEETETVLGLKVRKDVRANGTR